MTPEADIVVRSPNGDIALIIEVKSKAQATDAWAAMSRRNLATHGMIPASTYFLAALPDHFYLWKPQASIEAVNAGYKIAADDTAKEYLHDVNLKDLSAPGLELLLSAWVSDLIESKITEETEPKLAWLINSGLFESIKGGSIQTHATL